MRSCAALLVIVSQLAAGRRSNEHVSSGLDPQVVGQAEAGSSVSMIQLAMINLMVHRLKAG